MSRVIAYVDGFNLYFGLRRSRWRRYYWLDLPKLATHFLKPDQRLERTWYFTSRIRDNGRNSEDRIRQNTYIDALASVGVEIREGHYLEKQRTCLKCGTSWRDYEEKMTDVHIATQLLCDAYEDLFDVAFVVSGDSDLTSPIQRVRSGFAEKRVVVLFPPNRHSKQLQQTAPTLSISENRLRASQLPDTVKTPSGHVLARPAYWK